MSEPTGLWRGQQGAVSIYLILVFVPLFLLCGFLIDAVRWETAAKETENAVKAGVRSALSVFSPSLHAYGLFAILPEREEAQQAFRRTVGANVSGSISAEESVFRLIDNRNEENLARLTPMYPLANHEVFKRQILEEMKYRAPLIYSLEIFDKLKKTGLAGRLDQVSKFTEEAAKLEKPLVERDDRLDDAWEAFLAIRQKALDIHPFYQAQLRDLNVLSERIGIHTLEEVSSTLNSAKSQAQALSAQIQSIDGSIISLAQAGAAAVDAIRQLSAQREQLQTQLSEAAGKVTQYEQLLTDLTRYAELFVTLKLKSAADDDDLTGKLEIFRTAMKAAMQANEELNAEVRLLLGSSSSLPAEQSFGQIRLIAYEELNRFESDTGGAVSLFSGVRAQIGDGLLFTGQKYASTSSALDSFLQNVQKVYDSEYTAQSERIERNSSTKESKREERNKAQPYLDQIKRGLGSCSLISDIDPFSEGYKMLQGDPDQPLSKGYFQAYLELNQESSAVQPVPVIQLQDADHAGLSAMKLISSISDLVADVRDEFYVDEYALNKFNYRTTGMEKDENGAAKPAASLSKPDTHPLANQEVEYLLYGSSTCAGNLSLAYSEMFALRLAVGIAEALMEPKNETLAAGSPLLVMLSAVAEGAVNAQKDMAQLIAGETVPLSGKLGSELKLGYKDYLRIFLLLHSRDAVLLSRMQALLQLNTGVDLNRTATYVSGTVTTSFRLWFMPRAAQLIGRSPGLAGCQMDGSRCKLTKTADFTY